MKLEIDPSVAQALAAGRPVVALESTLICHGLPRPRNLELARAVEAAVRAEGAVPATIAIVDGIVRVGLDDDDAGPARPGRRRGQMLAARPGAGAGDGRPGRHHGRRHDPHRRRAPASGSWRPAASAGCIAAARAASTSRPTCTSSPAPASPWSAAAPRSSSTCRARWRCWRRWRCRWSAIAAPASRPSTPATAGCRCPSVDDLASLASLVRAQAELGWPTGIVVANPPPAELALPRRRAGATGSRRRWPMARERGIGGKDETPFLLAALARLSDGRTVTLNEALVLDNATARRRGSPGAAPATRRARAISLDALNHYGRNHSISHRIRRVLGG